MKLLTVSIAAYHVEDYLRETLDSFLIPEVTDQLEVLIVNDGSGEGVNEIAREYEANYPDVFCLIKWGISVQKHRRNLQKSLWTA